jgi:hypothetical protein
VQDQLHHPGRRLQRPPKTVEMARRLVEQDEVLFMLGTAK